MKRKQGTQNETLQRLEKNIEKLLLAAERLAGAADSGRRQLDQLSRLIALAEDILRRGSKRGISIEGQDHCDMCRPVNLEPEPDAADRKDEYFVNYGFGHFVEFSSYEELKKFQKMPPICGDDIETCDFDEIIRRMLAGDDTQP